MNTHATPPIARATRKNTAIGCMCAAPCSGPLRLGRLGGVERGRKPLLLAIVAGPVPELGPANSSRAMPPDQIAVRIFADDVEDKQILGGDDVAFHPDHLGDVGDPARAVTQAGGLD